RPSSGRAGGILRVFGRVLVAGLVALVAPITVTATAPAHAAATNEPLRILVSPDGSLVLVRTYRPVLAFARPPGRPLAAGSAVGAAQAPKPKEQGDASGFPAGGKGYVTTSEGEHAPIHTFAARSN